MGNADPQLRCHSRLDQTGSGGSRTRGTERGWRVVVKGRRSLLCLGLRYTEIIGRQHVFAPCSSATHSGLVATLSDTPQALLPSHTTAEPFLNALG